MRSLPNWTLNVARLGVITLFFILCVPVSAVEFSSETTQTQLVELYTSEGCSSCPPADRWLSKLKTSSVLWNTVVPVAYHVDYWDYIGWKDRFANPAYGARQRQHAAVGNLKTVYTPGFIVDGMEWRGWFKGEHLPAPLSKKPGQLKGQLTAGDLTIEFSPQQPHQQLIATVVLLGVDLVSNVDSGENADRTLHHDFAVLSEQSLPLSKVGDDGKFTASTALAEHPSANAIAVWVSQGAGLRPIQATGSWLDHK